MPRREKLGGWTVTDPKLLRTVSRGEVRGDRCRGDKVAAAAAAASETLPLLLPPQLLFSSLPPLAAAVLALAPAEDTAEDRACELCTAARGESQAGTSITCDARCTAGAGANAAGAGTAGVDAAFGRPEGAGAAEAEAPPELHEPGGTTTNAEASGEAARARAANPEVERNSCAALLVGENAGLGFRGEAQAGAGDDATTVVGGPTASGMRRQREILGTGLEQDEGTATVAEPVARQLIAGLAISVQVLGDCGDGEAVSGLDCRVGAEGSRWMLQAGPESPVLNRCGVVAPVQVPTGCRIMDPAFECASTPTTAIELAPTVRDSGGPGLVTEACREGALAPREQCRPETVAHSGVDTTVGRCRARGGDRLPERGPKDEAVGDTTSHSADGAECMAGGLTARMATGTVVTTVAMEGHPEGGGGVRETALSCAAVPAVC
mmetsp:Transcript_165178/g.530127  ORF Transcript_165178/g.530127 Transcript_165178/m.530127 type:complete len:437 (-) Transcript_165178:161-1471(-)